MKTRMAWKNTAVVAGLALAGGLAAPDAGAQMRQARVMDDGDGPVMVQFASSMGQKGLRTPEFVIEDLPLFVDRLGLSDDQSAYVGARISAYGESFQTAVAGAFPKRQGIMFGGGGMGWAMDVDHGDGEHEGAIRDLLSNVVADLGDADGDVEIESGGMAIMIASDASFTPPPPVVDEAGESMGYEIVVDANMEDTGGGEGPQAGVAVQIAGPEGMELPPEVMEKLRKHAEEMAERIEQQMHDAAENGDGIGIDFDPEEAIAAHEAHMEEMEKAAKAFEVKRDALRDEFVADVQGSLTEGQIDRWPSLERALVRVKSLPTGRLDGERTDLFRVIERVDIPEDSRTAASAELEAYEIALYDKLQRRDDLVREAEQKMNEAMSEGNHDRALAYVDRATQARIAVRRVNDQYAELVANTLPETAADAFRTETLRTSFPTVFRTSRAEREFEAVRDLEGIAPETIEALDELELVYRNERDRSDELLMQTIRSYEPKEPRLMIERLAGLSGEGGHLELGSLNDGDPVSELKTKRREMDRRYVESIRAMLTPEQVAELPALPKQRAHEPIRIFRSSGTPLD